MASKDLLSGKQVPGIGKYSTCSLSSVDSRAVFEGICIATCNADLIIIENQSEQSQSPPDSLQSDLQQKLVVSDTKFCNACQSQFEDRDEQLVHYKSDWHRYNLHLRLKGATPVSEDYFETVSGDVSSISGSDEDESESEDTTNIAVNVQVNDHNAETASQRQRNSHKIFLKNEKGDLLSVYRCLLHHRKNPITDNDQLIGAVKDLPQKSKWAIFMVSCGHFAGAVFDKNQVLEHKTFHRYTVRKKRGTAQSSHDKKGGHAKSAGANLRRYNEAALVQEVQELLAKWKELLSSCQLVFLRVPVANREMFFAGKNAPFTKDDLRIRVMPFPTRRPTFSELKRVHQMLSYVECYGPAAEIGECTPKSPQRFYDKESGQLQVRESNMNFQKSPTKVRVKTAQVNSKLKDMESPANSLTTDPTDGVDAVNNEESIDMKLVEEKQEIDLSHLKEFEVTPKKKRTKKTQPSDSKVEGFSTDEKEIRWKNSLFTAVKTGNENILKIIFREIITHHDEKFLPEATDVTTAVDNNSVSQVLPPSSIEQNGDTYSEVAESENDTHVESSSGDIDIDVKPKSGACLHDQMAEFLNRPLGDGGQRLLHVASKEGQTRIVQLLLENGADPALKDKYGKLPYNLGTQDARNVFRRFMSHWPDKYNYAAAQVPSPLSEEMEAERKKKAAEKRKLKKKAANERNKDKKAAEAVAREEAREKERFLNLSDREKRALAAERRILQQHNTEGSAIPVLSRCYQCGADMTGKVPFEYSDFKFCATKCLREHRSKVAKQ